MLSRPSKPPKRPRDINQLAYQIVQEATREEAPDGGSIVLDCAAEPPKNPAAVALGKLGGSKGGKARAAKLSPARRKAIARKAAKARWKNREG